MEERENRCRICLREDTNPGNDITMTRFWDLTGVDAIRELFGIKINLSERNLPRKLCLSCRKSLEIAVQLKFTALQTYEQIEEWKDPSYLALPKIEVKLDCLFEYKDHDVYSVASSSSPLSSVKEEPDSEKVTLHETLVEPSMCSFMYKEEEESNSMTFVDPPAMYEGYLPETYATEPNNDDEVVYMFCNECGKSFTRRTSLIRHIRSHVENRAFTCSFCSKSFQRPYCLKRHMRTHTGERPYACTHCPRSFADRSNLMAHIRLHTGESQTRRKPKRTRDVFECNPCAVKFRKRTAYKKHMRRVHGERDITVIKIE